MGRWLSAVAPLSPLLMFLAVVPTKNQAFVSTVPPSAKSSRLVNQKPCRPSLFFCSLFSSSSTFSASNNKNDQHHHNSKSKSSSFGSSSGSGASSTMDSLSFISDICGTLKKIKRTGWLMRKVPLPESDADHMHRCAMCALLLSQPADPRDVYCRGERDPYHPSNVDTTRLLRMAVTHDLCEALAGDVTPFCDPTLVASKHDKEKNAMMAIRKVVGDPLGGELFALWREYEEQQTPEAVYCKDIDKFEMVVQAFEYEKEHLKPHAEVVAAARQAQLAPSSSSGSATATASTGDTAAAATALVPKPDHDSTAPGNNDRDLPRVDQEPLRRFYITTNSVMKTPLFRRLDQELRQRREAMLAERGWKVTDPERQQEQNIPSDNGNKERKVN